MMDQTFPYLFGSWSDHIFKHIFGTSAKNCIKIHKTQEKSKKVENLDALMCIMAQKYPDFFTKNCKYLEV